MKFKCGHPKTPNNSYEHHNQTGSHWVSCKICKQAYSKKNRAKSREYSKKFNESQRARDSETWFYKSKGQYEQGKPWVISRGRT